MVCPVTTGVHSTVSLAEVTDAGHLLNTGAEEDWTVVILRLRFDIETKNSVSLLHHCTGWTVELCGPLHAETDKKYKYDIFI